MTLQRHKNDDESMTEFRAAYEYATRNRHCTTKIELFKSFWNHNIRHIDMELTDVQIEQFIDKNKSISDAVYSAANWMLDQPLYN